MATPQSGWLLRLKSARPLDGAIFSVVTMRPLPCAIPRLKRGSCGCGGSGGNLGTGGNGLEKIPARVGTGVDWVDVSVASTSSSAHTLGLKDDGTLYGWGNNYQGGQLGLPVYDGQGSFLIREYQKRLADRTRGAGQIPRHWCG